MVSFRGPDPTGEPVTERMYLTRDGSRLVSEGDPDAFMLAAAVGATVPRYILERIGKGRVDETDLPAKSEPAVGDDVSAAGDPAEQDEPTVTDKSVRGPKEPRKR